MHFLYQYFCFSRDKAAKLLPRPRTVVQPLEVLINGASGGTAEALVQASAAGCPECSRVQWLSAFGGRPS